MSEKKVKVTQTRSSIRRIKKQKLTLAALGLGRIGRSREIVVTPSTAGMLKAVQHLIEVEAVK